MHFLLTLAFVLPCGLTDPPGKPSKPVIEDYDKDRALIKWEPPKDDGGSPITGYVVEKKKRGEKWDKVGSGWVKGGNEVGDVGENGYQGWRSAIRWVLVREGR